MKTKRLKYFLLISAVMMVLTKILFSVITPAAEMDERVFLPVIFPDAVSFSEKKLTPEVYGVFDEYDDLLGYCFNTYDITPEVRGYAGPIKLFVGLKSSGELSAVRIIAHNETKIYMQKLLDDNFLEQFSFKNIRAGFIVDNDLDGVTHATVSAEAIAKAVRKSARLVARTHLKMDIAVDEEAGVSKNEIIEALVLFIITVCAVILFIYKKANTFSSMKERDRLITGYRDLLLIVVILFVGFYKSSPVSVTNIVNIFYLRLPEITNLFFYVLIGGLIIVTLLFGRVYCGYLCPFSALIEFVEKIKTKKIKTYDSELTVIKYIFLWAIVILVLYFDKVEISSFEPYLALFSSNKNVFMWTTLSVILAFTLFHKRIWCRYFCALGAVLALITKISPFSAKLPDGCTSCGACNAVCPVEIDFSGIDSFSSEECIACRKCHEYCIKRQSFPNE